MPLQKQPPPARHHQLRPTLRGPQRLDEVDGERQIEQAGRSSTNLNAHASSQSMRQASRPTSRASSRAKSQKMPLLGIDGVAAAPTPRTLSPVPAEESVAPSKRSSPIPAPLISNNSNSSSSDGSRKLTDDDGGNSSPRDSLAAPSRPLSMGSVIGGAEHLPSGAQSPVARPLQRPLQMSQLGSTTSLSRLGTPRSVRDLGSDYTRYYNPFSTHNNSQQDLSTTLPRYNSTTHLVPTGEGAPADLSHRYSNPFVDHSRRTSSIIEPAQDSTPGTPKLKAALDSAPDVTLVGLMANEKEPGVTATSAPARTGTPVFIHDADPEKTPFFPYIDDRLGAPYSGFPLYNDQKEDDDDMHMPQWDDDVRFKPTLRDHFNRRNIVNTLGMIFLLLGLLCVFVVLPIVSYTGTSLIPYNNETPLGQFPGHSSAQPWAHVNNRNYPLLQNIRTGLIDPDTPSSAKTRTSRTGQELVLVFSDEFNAENRTFYPGDDPYWYAPDLWYGATQDLEWYDPDAANTGGGTLKLQLDQFQNHGLNYRSGMLQSWNQLCFKGGVFEVSMSLPGPAGVHGLWPGAWTMGNLGRPGYLATTDGMWPYTYDECDAGITPNQSMTDGTSNLPGQRLAACTCSGEDHPTPGTGRGAPEIDIAEVSGDWGGKGLGVATQSYQVAPFDIWYYPNYNFMETPNYNISYVNTYTGGPYQQAVSTTSMLNNGWYDGNEFQKYAFEYTPGGSKSSGITWYIGDDEMMRFDARAIGPNGNVGQRLVSEEPMSMVLNLGISHSWVDINFADLRFPTTLQVDYVRWYQPADAQLVTCDPPGYETTDYIAKHPEAYNNPNLTHWAATGYDWPKNTLMNDCSA